MLTFSATKNLNYILGEIKNLFIFIIYSRLLRLIYHKTAAIRGNFRLS